jgi:predicted GNAT family N-acyltransferase
MRVGPWSELGADARRIRTEVFVEEQRIPKDLEHDAADLTAVHAVACNRLGQAVATGRLITAAPGVAQVGRLAVNRVLRGGQLGRQVLQALTDAARARGDREVMLHAQRSAEGFYERLGYQRRGEPFEEAGITHVECSRSCKRVSTQPPRGACGTRHNTGL